jgi:putative oxidoreductase
MLLRLSAGLSMMAGELSPASGLSEITLLGLGAASFAAGFLLVIGLWTPAAGVAQTIVEVWIGSAERWNAPHFISASIGLSLAMLGPGACSVDARLFGRKRIDV